MVGMKYDMTGAATVLAVALAAARLALPVRVTAWLCIAENMPSGTAIRPNDVLRIRGGTTVEVLNTDAEGRLVLADGLVAASEEQPDAIIDVATLTGAAMVALGNRYAGVMGDDDARRRRCVGAAKRDRRAALAHAAARRSCARRSTPTSPTSRTSSPATPRAACCSPASSCRSSSDARATATTRRASRGRTSTSPAPPTGRRRRTASPARARPASRVRTLLPLAEDFSRTVVRS